MHNFDIYRIQLNINSSFSLIKKLDNKFEIHYLDTKAKLLNDFRIIISCPPLSIQDLLRAYLINYDTDQKRHQCDCLMDISCRARISNSFDIYSTKYLELHFLCLVTLCHTSLSRFSLIKAF